MSAAEAISAGAGPQVIACWSCRGPTPAIEPFCATCGAVQPPGQIDHFRRLGLEPGFAVDIKEVERRYFQLQRRLHPDRFATRSARERALSQAQATSLNEAYETLMNPLRRARYLLAEAGIQVAAEDGQTIDDPALLMEAMEMREELSEAETAPQLARVKARADEVSRSIEASLGHVFETGALGEARRLTLRLKYLSKLLEEIELRRRMPQRLG